MLSALLLACSGSDPTDPSPSPDDPTVPGDDDDDDDTAPPGDTDTAEPGPPVLSAVSAALHPQFGSLVVVDWTQDRAATVHLEYSFDDGVWLSSPERELEAGAHEELLLGVPYEVDVTWRIVAAADGEATTPDAVATTGSLPPTVPEGLLRTSDPARLDPAAPYLFLSLSDPDDFGEPWWVLIVDRQLRPVWAVRSPNGTVSMHSRVAKDGRSLFVDRNSFWATFDGGDASSIVQIRLDGTVVAEFDTPGLHHPMTDLPDGSVAYGASIWPGYGNEFLEIVHPDGTTETLWDCEAWLADIGEIDFCMSNTLNYDEATDSYLFSFWSMETVVRIDGTTGETLEWYGHTDGAWAFDPPSSEFWWQHGGYFTDAGTFLTSSDLTTSGGETIVREYELDPATQTLRLVWTFGVGEGLFGNDMGEAVRLANGNTLHNYGHLARLREATLDGEVVWDAEWPSDAIGRSMPVSDLYALLPDRP